MQVFAVYARPEAVLSETLELEDGATLGDALQMLRANKSFEALLEQTDLTVGVFGRVCPMDEPLRAKDRIEFYRPLQMDAKEARRARAAQQQAAQ